MKVNVLDPQNWVNNYSDTLYSMAVFKTGDKESSFDLVQETFLSALKAKENFRGDSSEKTWLIAILNHKIIDTYRKKNRYESLNEYLENTNDSFNSHFFDNNPNEYGHTNPGVQAIDWGDSAESDISKKEFQSILQYCLSKLPAKMAPVFIAKYIDEKKSEEICNEFNITPSNFWVVMHRSKLVLRTCLEKNWFLTEKNNGST